MDGRLYGLGWRKIERRVVVGKIAWKAEKGAEK